MSFEEFHTGVTVPDEGTILTGIGDEVVAAGVGTLFITLATVVVLLKVRGNSAPPNVHPDQAESVENTRREMGVVDNRQEPADGNTTATDAGQQTNCPICLNELAHFVETNCGHVFCAHCILSYWQHDQWPRPARCAVCRRPVSCSVLICMYLARLCVVLHVRI